VKRKWRKVFIITCGQHTNGRSRL